MTPKTSDPVRSIAQSIFETASPTGREAGAGAYVIHWVTESSASVDAIREHAEVACEQGEPAPQLPASALQIRTDTGAQAHVERLLLFLMGEINRGVVLDHPALVNNLREAVARALFISQGHPLTHPPEKPTPAPPSVEEPASATRVALLTPREREVCALVARGMLNKQIAAELGISEGIVERHRGRAAKKLGVGSAAELGRLWGRVEG